MNTQQPQQYPPAISYPPNMEFGAMISGMMRPNSGYTQPQGGYAGQPPLGGPRGPMGGMFGGPPVGQRPFQPHDLTGGTGARSFPHHTIFGQQQQPQSFDEWKLRVDPSVQSFVSKLIDANILKSTELDHGCVEELVRANPTTALQVLETFQSQSVNPPPSGPIRNPSAFITKMLKNPGGRGRGRGGRGEARGGRGGRGRGLGNEFNAQAQYAHEKLQQAMGDRFKDLDQHALNYISKQSKEIVDYVAEEWSNQQESVRTPSAWVTKIITAKSQQSGDRT